MTNAASALTHVSGTFLIQANGAFLNGAGIGGVGDDRNNTVPKTFQDGRNSVPYVSAQAWKHWLRATAVEEAGWPASRTAAIAWNNRGNVSQVVPQLNPVEFPEDDIFGYMHARPGQGRRREPAEDEEEEESDAEGDTKVRAVMRTSPFAASLLVSLRSTGWTGKDDGFVHFANYDAQALATAEVERFLQVVSSRPQGKEGAWERLQRYDGPFSLEVKAAAERADHDQVRELLQAKAKETGREVRFIENPTSPLPYSTRFYNTHLQGIFCLDYDRMGVFSNIGDRYELEPTMARAFLRQGRIEEATAEPRYSLLTDNGKTGKVYRLTDISQARRDRAAALLRSLGPVTE